ncbi:hypothetical protein, variant [Exophiala mesophila]|uniref:Cytochrome b2, mitochondrial n=1 Tax=Exophiala mesophila TaxID=212818 RepID=A0A0D1ZT34_EXOME|nr:uncharacterized protein PV10_07307 [Exophiala mesophila]XP_016221528.1 hypothetical protein, variant [Exophiala mesophila]KIV89953.1 hypothetical protein PV10_07307 [Exophiala mesophila]KIV89954.1 hypothetical protein, variant [Exophiala mesophila]
MSDLLHGLEVAKHNSKDSCWVIVSGKAYDVTDYLEKHPGGSAIILQYAGKDATSVYQPIHPAGTIEKALSADKHLGPVDPSTISTVSAPQVSRNLDKMARIPLSHCLNLDDIEKAAERIIDRASWAYFHSAADGLGALANNQNDWRKVLLRPRVMRNVRRVSMQRTMLGFKSRLPFFIAPAARAKLVHEDGELCLARGAARAGIPYCPSTYSTVPHDELAQCWTTTRGNSEYGALWFQLYIAHEKSSAIELITKARTLGYQALVITVDSPVVGKREEDERYRAELVTASGDASLLTEWSKPQESEDGPPLRGHHSSTLNWEDLGWIREAWQNAGPIALKGIQTAEDAAIAVEHGIDAIYLSNHGGRQCDDAPSGISTLLEIRKFYPDILTKAEFYLDGWVRRGADVIKALCLGAKGVALGRPFMYSVAMGDEGVMKVIQLLSEEIETTMRNMGASSLDQLNPSFVNTKRLELELPDDLNFAFNEAALKAKL